MNKQCVTGIFTFGENMTVNSWRVLRDCIGFGGIFSCPGDSGEGSMNEYVAGGGPFGENMSVNPWRVLRDCIGIVRHGLFLSRRFRRRKQE